MCYVALGSWRERQSHESSAWPERHKAAGAAVSPHGEAVRLELWALSLGDLDWEISGINGTHTKTLTL